MSNKLSESELKYAQRWRGHKVLDTKTNRRGLILGAEQGGAADQAVYLLCRFPDNPETVRVSLQKRHDLQCLVPGYARARYRIDN
jgi:hypothetical protein